MRFCGQFLDSWMNPDTSVFPSYLVLDLQIKGSLIFTYLDAKTSLLSDLIAY